MKRLPFFALAIVLVAGAARADENCRRVAGTFVFTSFTFTSATTATAEADMSGDLSGTAHADYFNIATHGDGATHMNGMHTLSTTDGTLTTFDHILLLPDAEAFAARPNSRLYVVGGTGMYEGATGLLHTHGRVNLATLAGSIQFKGRVCVSQEGQ